MGDLVYVQVHLEDGIVKAWSLGRGRLEPRPGPWTDLFKWVRAREPEAKLMIHVIGDEDDLDDNMRLSLMDKARDVGFSVVRFESGEPLDPEDAFGVMLLPFT
ncbi:MAG: hypothetical protein OEY50_04295 [Nitrospinota bacterium]|nr:hypothetical protein [Nitrospinota bacterium]MDH5679728.1 hypothetical protein [Nitrospinota bacterium]MDH5755657.1 hypothetical protein [Nitrospinota bacterium]